jgi:ferredoxin
MSDIIQLSALRTLVDGWIAEGKLVTGPTRVKPNLVLYQTLTSSEALLLDGYIHPANSIKHLVLPRHETLYRYRFVGKQIELSDAPPIEREQVVVGARPCDAAALAVLDHVFNWDSRDASYNRRRELTTVVTLCCRNHDEHCFCSSVGSGPADSRGSDVLLFDLGDGTFEARCLTEKGRRLFAGRMQPGDRLGEAGPGPTNSIAVDAAARFAAENFDSPLWPQLNARCLGCGACAHTCPTCHCFDIVDEGNAAGGVRARNWDACQFAMFTLHASGHNPRHNQGERGRQRILHKFHIYREKFGETLCTGCGNCSRNCPVALGVRPVLEEICRTLPKED